MKNKEVAIIRSWLFYSNRIFVLNVKSTDLAFLNLECVPLPTFISMDAFSGTKSEQKNCK
jgi:hypothetical protein